MAVVSGVKSFLLEKFWLPLTGSGADYNVFNTSVYAAGFALAAAYLGYPLLDRLDVSLDRDFFLSISPYVFLGGAARVLEDLGLVDSVLLVTPFIYAVMFAVTVALLFVSLKQEKLTGVEYHRVFGGLGLLVLLPLVALYLSSVASFSPLISVAVIFSLVTGAGYLAVKRFRPSLAGYGFTVPVAAHYWDATTSFVALGYGAAEKHVLASWFVSTFGPAGMFVMKTLVIVPATYYIYSSDLEQQEKHYYLFLVALLGLALGTRNLLSLLAA